MIKTAIIEDSQALASIYKAFLEDTDFDVSVFTSTGSDINRLMKQGGFKRAVCPCFPKFQDGSRVAQTIKSDPEPAKAHAHGTSLSFPMIDLDNFKRVNDDYGHDTGYIKPSAAACLRFRKRPHRKTL